MTSSWVHLYGKYNYELIWAFLEAVKFNHILSSYQKLLNFAGICKASYISWANSFLKV